MLNSHKAIQIRPTGCCVQATFYITLFPSYLEAYIRSLWDEVRSILKSHTIKGELNLIKGSIIVKTTIQTTDPLVILQARDFIRLLARSVPLIQAQKIFQDEMSYDIIKIGNIVQNKPCFIKRRERLVGPSGQTLRTLEILTNCYIYVQGKTVSVMGSRKGVKQARKIVYECMKNIHPVYGLKRLMILRELEKRKDLAHEDWSRFLPNYPKTHQRKKIDRPKPRVEKKEHVEKSKKRKTFHSSSTYKERVTFPEPSMPRKEDIAMQTGEVFLAPKKKMIRKRKTKIKSSSSQNQMESFFERRSLDEDIPDDDL